MIYREALTSNEVTGENRTSCSITTISGPEDIKRFSILNSADHEIYPAHKC